MTWALQDIISLVVQNFVPAHGTSLQYDTSGFKSRICGSWIEVLPQLSTVGRHGEALTSSIKAFGVAILSVNQNGYAPVADALAAQGSALQLLQLALRHVHQVHVNELSVAIMCLRISEVLHSVSIFFFSFISTDDFHLCSCYSLRHVPVLKHTTQVCRD